MEPQINLSDLNSYLELLIGFTFAYAGFDGFKKYINGISARGFSLQIKSFKKTLEEKNDKFIVIKNSENFILKKNSDFTLLEEQFNNISNEILNIYNGTHFQSMFYLTGLFYLFYIILVVFQGVISYKIIYPVLLILSLAIIIFHIRVIYHIFSRVKNLNNIKDSKLLSSHLTIRRFIYFSIATFFIFGLFVAGNLKDDTINNFFSCTDFIDLKYNSITFLYINNKACIKVLVLLSVISVPFLPYLFYYLRDRKFIMPLNLKLKEVSDKLKGLIAEMDATYEMLDTNNNLSEIKPEKKSGESSPN